MSITFPGTPTKFESATSGSTIPLANPGFQNGDMGVAFLRTNGASSPSDFALAGWTRRGYAFRPNDAAGRVFGVYTRPITDAASEPTTYTFSKSVADSRRAGVMLIARGVDLANPILGNSDAWSVESPAMTLLGYTLSASDAGATIYGFSTEVVSPNASAPTTAPGTELALAASSTGTSATRSVLWVGTEVTASSAQPSRSLTWTSSSGASATAVTLRAAASAPAPIPGFATVAHMLATPGATWAHRGGSTSWPEMSEYAYDQAVLAGYGALEFSANRTSDGVWVGVHDASLNRTSQTTGLPDISAMTWAQVQGYQNTLNSAGTPRPYYRLVDFLDKFSSTHVLVVDPKFALTRITEFFGILDAHGGPSKIVVKFSGVGSGAAALADAATARGYQTWGFFYEADVANGALATWQSHWSLLGMTYDASATAWAAVRSYGKPVVGHIAGSQANYDTARAKGARMVQCANVAGIAAVGAPQRPHLALIESTGGVARELSLIERAGSTNRPLEVMEFGA